ncbi:hypothetical protein ACWPKO_02610 [Coraliomargarita sp. W4R53]
MNNQQEDSFELFADTLTITLGCIIFIALLLVTITRSDQMDEGGLFHLERRSELVSKQIEIAAAQVNSSEAQLSQAVSDQNASTSRLDDYEAYAKNQIRNFKEKHESTYAEALLAENQRTSLFLTKLPWIQQTIEENSQSLEARINRAFTEAAEQPIALSVLREQDKTASHPIYWIIANQKLYPVPGGPPKQYRHITWAPYESDQIKREEPLWRLSPKETAGLGLDAGLQHLRKNSAELTRDSDYQIVLLIYEDSFAEGREILRALSSMDVNFSWRPLTQSQRILMSTQGLPPDAPF